MRHGAASRHQRGERAIVGQFEAATQTVRILDVVCGALMERSRQYAAAGLNIRGPGGQAAPLVSLQKLDVSNVVELRVDDAGICRSPGDIGSASDSENGC